MATIVQRSGSPQETLDQRTPTGTPPLSATVGDASRKLRRRWFAATAAGNTFAWTLPVVVYPLVSGLSVWKQMACVYLPHVRQGRYGLPVPGGVATGMWIGDQRLLAGRERVYSVVTMTDGPHDTTVEQAVLLAGRAPSLHNSQPWLWRYDGRVLRLYAVPERMLPTTDPSGRQMLISCGAALDHLRAAMVSAGWRSSIARFPDPNARNHLADIIFHRSPIVTEAELARGEVIDRRYTDRRPFGVPEGWPDFETVLTSTVDPYDAEVDVLPEDSRAALAHAARMTASLRRYDSGYHAELYWWTGHVISAAGVPRSALASSGEQERVGVGRQFPTRGAESEHEERADTDRAAILVLSTSSDGHDELVRCGEALSTVLLESTLAGYATCPLTHLTEVPRSREVVRDLIGGGHRLPQVLVRIGAPPQQDRPVERTPRLPLRDILAMTTT